MKRYQKEKLEEISFPLGGIGTGSIGLAGNGRFVDWQIENKPNWHGTNGFTHIAVKAEQEGNVLDARVLQGDFAPPYAGGETTGLWGNNGHGQGVDRCTIAGVPHFESLVFEGQFPFARLQFCDEYFPGNITLTAFNPMIPSNAYDSSLPAAFFEVEFENTSAKEINYTACFSLNNQTAPNAVNTYCNDNGCHLLYLSQNGRDKADPLYGNLCLETDGADVSFQEYWFRGEWFDNLTTFWNDFTRPGRLQNRSYQQVQAVKPHDRMRGFDMCSLAVHTAVPAQSKKTVRFVLSWSFPNYLHQGDSPEGKETIEKKLTNYYATVFENSKASAQYCMQEFNRLKKESLLFADTLHHSTLPEPVLDAVTNTLSVLHSPTCYRFGEEGIFYGWEGCNGFEGSCEGSCTHVWNYAYALPFLFPELERSMRDAHFSYDMKETGSLGFRTLLPFGIGPSKFRACADGQFGDIIKCYRDWKISGDTDWLRKNWPSIKKAMAFTWSKENEDLWDPEKSGVLTGRQHHTLDMELFGPNSWLTGFYLCALKAAAEMAKVLDDTAALEEYQEIYEKGKKALNSELFNGSYFTQTIDLKDKSVIDRFHAPNYWNEEAQEIKYQIGTGCSIDQATAQWHANLCGLGEIFEKDKLNTALHSLYRHNFKKSFRNFFNACRIYALNDEGGLIICEWPENKPAIPITYSDEVMTGFEYEAACLMIMEGMEQEGLEVVSAIRNRYDGKKRNPFNEIECGSYYARAMASYSLLLAYSGFTYDLANGMIGFCPLHSGDFSTFWSVDGAWGKFERQAETSRVTVLYGNLALNEIRLPYLAGEVEVLKENKPVAAQANSGAVCFANTVMLAAGESIIFKNR